LGKIIFIQIFSSIGSLANGNVSNAQRLVKNNICESLERIFEAYDNSNEGENIYVGMFKAIVGLTSDK
jgi:hypothetical protein